ncbi:MAG: putative Ig domain-containing protein, partial [Sulfuricurvum sp.]|uniref:calcium-binding protein n=1 Tax=Sulfuricurvum sp. TaxID=2025608 RepID=UPI0025D43632
LSYTASLSDGTALPSWLTFEGDTRTFQGTAPSTDAGKIHTVALTATDAAGESVTDTMDLKVILPIVRGSASLDYLYGTDGGEDTLYGLGGNDYMFAFAGDDTMDGGTEADFLYAGDGIDTLIGGEGNDYMFGENGNDTLYGGEGNDYMLGENGNDTLIGNSGNDRMSGGAGNDLYLFDIGSGQDVINDIAGTGSDKNIVRMGSGILTSDIILERVTQSGVTLRIAGTSDQVTLENWFLNPMYRGTNIEFADGTVWDDTVLSSAQWGVIPVQTGTASREYLYGTDGGADTLYGLGGGDYMFAFAGDDIIDGGDGMDFIYAGDGVDTLIGGEGNDYLFGENGNDTLYGGEGNDYLFGENGNDTLDGNSGNDQMSGGAGNDLYRFDLGSGQDVINESIGSDTVKFGTGIAKSDIAFFMEGSSLLVDIGGEEYFTVTNQSYANNAIERFELYDGSYLSNIDVNLIVQNITAFAADNGISISNVDSVRANQDLMNIVAAGWHP